MLSVNIRLAMEGLVRLFVVLSFGIGTFADHNNEVRFLVVGDWGGQSSNPYTTTVEKTVSKSMGKLAEKDGCQFTVALGDNFYSYGVKNVDDKRFQETFEDVFTAKSLMTPWYFCAGNHDHRGNVSAQIAYSSKSSRWKFPDYYYTRSWKIPGSEKQLQLVLLDTVMLCGNSGHDHLHNQPKEPENSNHADEQWQWIESTLNSSTAHYLIVGGHYPVWSIAEHGPTWCLVDRLKPLLQKYDVTAYISGHDHNLQHLKENDFSVEYFVIGSGAKVDNNKDHIKDVPAGSSRFFWADLSHEGGFAVVHAAVDNMTLGLVDSEGNILYNRQMYPRVMPDDSLY